jgi:predicted nuclease with RNAse H fold
MKRGLFTGIDLASFERHTACLVLDEELRLLWFDSLLSDDQIVEAVQRYHPHLVAVDAPLSLPKGLCCPEEACSCQPLLPAVGDPAEGVILIPVNPTP